MSRAVLLTAAMLMALALPASAEPRVVCTLAIETGAKDPLVREGSCEQRISPASTFKIPISLMAFDSGILLAPDSSRVAIPRGLYRLEPAVATGHHAGELDA